MYDTVAQYRQVIGNMLVDDWHPPIMVRLWQLLRPLGTGTAPMFALQTTFYAAGFALIVGALVRCGRWRAAIAAAALGLSPLLLGWQMVVLKDAQMLGALLAAVGIVAYYRLQQRSIPPAAVVAAAILIAYATFVRANAAFATAPLIALLLPTRHRPLLGGAVAVGGAALAIALAPVINHDLLRAEPSDVAKSEPLFDLAGIAVRTPSDAPSPFTRAERTEIAARHCVKPFFWDSLTDPAGCEDATERLLTNPADRLYLELARAAAAHPFAYAAHRLAHWNSTERWLVPPNLPDAGPPAEAEANGFGLAGPQDSAAFTWQDAATAEAATPLGWPIVWTVVAGLLAPVAWRRRSEPEGGLALALLASALTLEASFLAISIASDLRYHLWPMAASALALILLCDRIDWRRRTTIAAAVLLAAIAAAGVFARASLPPAPSSYEQMIRSPSA
jgi:hypothetical protein